MIKRKNYTHGKGCKKPIRKTRKGKEMKTHKVKPRITRWEGKKLIK